MSSFRNAVLFAESGITAPRPICARLRRENFLGRRSAAPRIQSARFLPRAVHRRFRIGERALLWFRQFNLFGQFVVLRLPARHRRTNSRGATAFRPSGEASTAAPPPRGYYDGHWTDTTISSTGSGFHQSLQVSEKIGGRHRISNLRPAKLRVRSPFRRSSALLFAATRCQRDGKVFDPFTCPR